MVGCIEAAERGEELVRMRDEVLVLTEAVCDGEMVRGKR